MKTKILITGQPHGNFKLNMHLQNEAEKAEKSFQDYYLSFHTKKQARAALKGAYMRLRELEPDFYKDGGINLIHGEKLLYDASRAYIITG